MSQILLWFWWIKWVPSYRSVNCPWVCRHHYPKKLVMIWILQISNNKNLIIIYMHYEYLIFFYLFDLSRFTTTTNIWLLLQQMNVLPKKINWFYYFFDNYLHQRIFKTIDVIYCLVSSWVLSFKWQRYADFVGDIMLPRSTYDWFLKTQKQTYGPNHPFLLQYDYCHFCFLRRNYLTLRKDSMSHGVSLESMGGRLWFNTFSATFCVSFSLSFMNHSYVLNLSQDAGNSHTIDVFLSHLMRVPIYF